MRPLGRALIQPDWCLSKKRKFGQRERETEDVQRIDHVRTQRVFCGVFSWHPWKTNTQPNCRAHRLKSASAVHPLRSALCAASVPRPHLLPPPPQPASTLTKVLAVARACVVPCRPSPCTCCVLCRKACSPTWQLPSLLRDSFPGSPPPTSVTGPLSRALVEVIC